MIALHVIYLDAFTNYRPPIELPSHIDVQQILNHISLICKTGCGVVRIYGRKGLLYELHLHACYSYISANFPPLAHLFWQFINGLKVSRQHHWKSCIRDGHFQPINDENLCDTLLALDDMAPWVTYALRPMSSDSDGKTSDQPLTTLFPDHASSKEIIISIAQLSRIIGRQMELHFYDHLKKALARVGIDRKVVLDVGRTLMSLRRRLTQWTHYWAGVPFHTESEHEAPVNDEEKSDDLSNDSMNRLKQLCKILYVYFCYMRRRLPLNEQEGMRTMMVFYPDSEEEVEENFPQDESIAGFEQWLSFKDLPAAETTIDNNQM